MIKKISNFTALKHIIDKLSKIFSSYRLFYAFLFFLPLGIDKIWLSQKSYYYGYFSFYNTFYLNFTDFLFLGVMTAWLWEKISQKSTPPSIPYSRGGNEASNPSYSPPKIGGVGGGILWSFVFWLILAISTIISPASPGGGREIWLALYGLARITQVILVFSYVREKISISQKSTPLYFLIVGLTLQAVLAISQFIFQTSFDLKTFGESFLRPGLLGIAEFVSRERFHEVIYQILPYLRQNSGEMVLIRGYGTLPHPNILSGLLFVGVMVNLYMLYISKKSPPPSPPYSGGEKEVSTPSYPPPKRGGVGGGILC